tara:strand:+ start:205 stop:324 length:120 start_codon:yes stop_codon:yes gene_type:complete
MDPQDVAVEEVAVEVAEEVAPGVPVEAAEELGTLIEEVI